jgi:hypothetical protein
MSGCPIIEISRTDIDMFGFWLRALLFLALSALVTAAPVRAAGPGPKFKLLADDPNDTMTTPDQQVNLEQYSKNLGNDGDIYQFWTFDSHHKHPFLLNKGEGTDLAGYAAGFRFSPDSQWLVRLQKLGAGYMTLFLYHRDGFRFSSATRTPLGDLAWDYFFSQPASKSMIRDPKDRYSLDHATVVLIKGLEENYAWMGEHWPDRRYLVISLSFDIQGQDKPTPWIEGWHCVYDMKTGQFSVPPDFAENNAKAIKQPGSDPG